MAFRIADYMRRGPAAIAEEQVTFLDLPLEEYGLIALYVAGAMVWSTVSGSLLDYLGADPVDSPALQALNALNFLLISGILLFAVLRRSYRVQRRARAASRLSHARFEAVARATTDAIWDWDLENNTVWRSESFQHLFGYSAEDLSPTIEWWFNRLHPADRERVVEGIHDVINRHGQSWHGQYKFQRRDGSYAEVLDRTQILRDPTQRPVRVVGGISDITERRRAEEALEQSHRQLRALSARLEAIREDERTRIAREIHDELGQVLTALKIDLDWIENRLSESANDARVNPLIDRIVNGSALVDATIDTVQRIVSDLRPAALDTLGLAAAVAQECERFQKQTGIPVQVKVPDDLGPVQTAVTTAIYRALQESLTNVARHAQASRVAVELRTLSPDLWLEVTDNGRGIDAAQVDDTRSLGLLGMRERASVLGGELSVAPLSPCGTRVALRLPRDADDQRFWAELRMHLAR
jgi:two-component system sensor histidine kinase UhpB